MRRLERVGGHLCCGLSDKSAGRVSGPQSIGTSDCAAKVAAPGSMKCITTHALNTATGKPASGLRLALLRRDTLGDGAFTWERVSEHVTNDDGRVDGDVLAGLKLQQGAVFKMVFETQGYFDQLETECFYPHVEIVFKIFDPSAHYHIPLLISPFGYSTYRGS
uniref:hydroxyisourate hydrolase n=1 Tax=Mucochytrium quahogii TaxID=96639 RepID=A0A7S2RV68_9STRA|mmetsp:Transcript_7134/g.11341  ORF Transcript_7134/g.11341 Transcript_7134/m.11341 type:complete len:163 (-) Transcript_7134:51-539(-)